MGKYYQPFVLAILVISLLILLNAYMAQNRFVATNVSSEQIDQQLLENRLYSSYLDTLKDQNNYCKLMRPLITLFVEQTNRLGDQVYLLEQNEEFESKSLLRVKKAYTLQNFELWMYLVNHKARCPDQNYQTVLYFYTNQPGNCLECQAQQVELEKVVNDSNNLVWVFAFEGEIGLDLINLVKQQFQIDHYPSMVINEKRKITGFSTSQKVLSLLH